MGQANIVEFHWLIFFFFVAFSLLLPTLLTRNLTGKKEETTTTTTTSLTVRRLTKAKKTRSLDTASTRLISTSAPGATVSYP